MLCVFVVVVLCAFESVNDGNEMFVWMEAARAICQIVRWLVWRALNSTETDVN